MKFTIKISVSILGLFILASSAYAFAPTPVKVTAEATTPDSSGNYQVNNIDGIGNWIVPAKLSESLEFWNVGEEGGALYATAIWTQTWIPIGNGEVVTEVLFNKALNRTAWHREPADSQPVIEPKIQTLRFSGGPNGTFTTESGNISRYKIISDGKGGLMVTGSNIALFVRNPEAFDAWTTEEAQVPTDSGARFSGMTGQVEWRADDDPDGWKLCKMDDKLPVYAHIRTQEDSNAILNFSDMSTFILKADSEVVITTPPEKESKIKLVAGNIWVNIKKMINEGSMEIEMNQAVAGIKGTTLVLSDDGKTSTLQVIEGEVQFTAKVGGGQVMVEGGSMITASAKGIGAVEKFDAEKESKMWEEISVENKSIIKSIFNSKFFYSSIALVVIILVIGKLLIGRRKKKY